MRALYLPAFLPVDDATAIRNAALAVEGERASVTAKSRMGETTIRGNHHVCRVADTVMAPLVARVSHFGAQIGEHLACTLVGAQAIEVLRYRERELFATHRDRGGPVDATDPTAASARQVSLVVFLSDEHEGGELQLLNDDATRLEDDPLAAGPPAVGDAVAFQSDVLHRVTPVTGGVRVTAVAWYV